MYHVSCIPPQIWTQKIKIIPASPQFENFLKNVCASPQILLEMDVPPPKIEEVGLASPQIWAKMMRPPQNRGTPPSGCF